MCEDWGKRKEMPRLRGKDTGASLVEGVKIICVVSIFPVVRTNKNNERNVFYLTCLLSIFAFRAHAAITMRIPCIPPCH